MNNTKKQNPIIITLIVLAAVVWSLALAGFIKGSFGGGHTPALKTEGSENKQDQLVAQLAPQLSQDSDGTVPDPLQQALDISGTWDISFHRYSATGYEGVMEPIGMEEVYLWMEIYPGKQFECEIMPVEAYINGEQYFDWLALEPQLWTGEIVGNTLRLYLDLDSFYLDYTAEVTDTIDPMYIEIPLTQQNGSLFGSYAYTWVTTIEGYDLESRVSFEISKR